MPLLTVAVSVLTVPAAVAAMVATSDAVGSAEITDQGTLALNSASPLITTSPGAQPTYLPVTAPPPTVMTRPA
jgi:hypothetical protein